MADADLILGYLDPEDFSGGQLTLDVEAARVAIDEHIARPLGISIEDAAKGIVKRTLSKTHEKERDIAREGASWSEWKSRNWDVPDATDRKDLVYGEETGLYGRGGPQDPGEFFPAYSGGFSC